MRHLKGRSGFILPSAIVISLAVIAVLVGLLMTTTASYRGGYTEHYQKLADEAAEAGSAYATACLSLSGHIQTWGAAAGQPNLTPNADCNGANSYPANTYVYSNTKVRTYFVVGDLDYSAQFSAQVSAQGYAQALKPDGSVLATYTSIQKKVLAWPTEVEGQMSSSGTNRTCAIVNYRVYCWGYNAYGQLGDGRYIGSGGHESASAIDSTIPVKVTQEPGVMADKKIVKIFVAQYHSCALSDDGLMYCWGFNGSGQLGQGNQTDSPVPVQVGGALAGKVVTDIGGTNNATCAIADSKIYCWGSNDNGMTGRNTTSGNSLSPGLVTASNTSTTLPTSYAATALSTSGSRAKLMCAIANGKAYCWGQNTAGSVGDNSTTLRQVPTKVNDSGVLSGKTITSISLDGYSTGGTDGYGHVCAVASGSVYCWGENNYGQLGNNSGSNADSSVPVAVIATGVLSGKTVQDVKVGLRHSCALADGGAYCWGLSSSGQVGDGGTATRKFPVAVAQQPGNLTATNVISIGAGANRGCAVVIDGRTFCWGLNSTGQIGDGTKNNNRLVPTESLFLRPTGNQYIF